MQDNEISNEDNEDEAMNCGLGVAERDLLVNGLHSLPDAPPPRDVWKRIAEQAEAEGLFAQAKSATRWQWYAGAGLAAAMLLVLLRLPGMPQGDPGQDAFPTEPSYTAIDDSTDLAALMVQSQVLERGLQALPAKPSMMRAGTAATIGDLEDRIAAIDHVLNDSAVTLTDEQQQVYWRERVRLMDSLLQLRYAQARRNTL